MDGVTSEFIVFPSDVVAYFSPFRESISAPAPRTKKGSPLSNWQEPVTVNSFSHTFSPNPPIPGNRLYNCESSADITVEIDLLKNERLNFYWVGLFGATSTASAALTEEAEATSNITGAGNIIEIDYICGYEDLDLAQLLPCDSAKDFISDFIRQFNLDFRVLAGNTVQFVERNEQVSFRSNNIDITPFVHDETIEYLPARTPVNYIVGYDNDTDDRLLTQLVSGCADDTREVTEYANVTISGNENIYSTGDKVIRNFFSATRFYPALFETIPFPVMGAIEVNMAGVTPDFVSHFNFGPTTNIRYDIPSIQSPEQFAVTQLGDLEYRFKYKPRLMYFKGTYQSLTGEPDTRFFVNAPDLLASTREHHWFKPTVCSFDMENVDLGSMPRTLRYDGPAGLYNEYFNDTIESRGDAYLLKADMNISPYLWTQLTGDKFVTLKDDLYQILSIEDYDPINNNPAQITLLKLV